MDRIIRTKEQWDQAAPDYQKKYRLGQNSYNRALLSFWEENGMLRPGCRVIDIGCGVGKYGVYFAQRGCDVTLTDISSGMLRLAAENMSGFGTPVQLYRCDFNEVSGNEAVFSEGFDLSVSTMSPAVHDIATIKKMSAMTHGWCFLTRFISWSQPNRDKYIRALGSEPQESDAELKLDCSGLIQAVCDSGYTPNTKYADYNWCDMRTPGEAADYILKRYSEKLGGISRAEAVKAAEQLCNAEGLFEDAVNTKVMWLYWRSN